VAQDKQSGSDLADMTSSLLHVVVKPLTSIALFLVSTAAATSIACQEASQGTLLLQHQVKQERKELERAGVCPYNANSGIDCGFPGITQEECQARGCCWDPESPSMWCYPSGGHQGQTGSHSRKATRFLSWNVYYANNLRGRAWRIADGILEVDPEIVSLQELWHEWDEILSELNQRSTGTWEFARGGETETNWDGDILYRADLWTLEESGMRAYGDRGVSWAALSRRSDGAGVVVAGTHPWCCTNDEPILRTVQNDILTVVKEQRMKRPTYPAAVLGDMNAGYYSHSQHLMREGRRSAFNRDWDIRPYTFKDSYAINGQNPDVSTGTWGGGKIDFVYFEDTPINMGQVVESKVWKNCDRAGSDHCAVSGDIVLSGRGGETVPVSPSPMTTPRPASSSCAAFDEWPDVDNGVVCKSCTALVLTEPHGGRCDTFCASFGHVCVAAAEEENENCEVKYETPCDQEITSTSDMLCTCELPSTKTTTRAASTTRSSTSTSVSTTQSEPVFEEVDGGAGRACRGASSTDNAASYYMKTTASTIYDCKDICVATPSCVGVEFGEKNQRCEIWTRQQGIRATSSVSGYTCLRYLSTHDSTKDFQPVDGGDDRACRGLGGVADNNASYYTVQTVTSLELCKAKCRVSQSCKGVEWWEKHGRCEVWSSPIGVGKVVSGFMCLRFA